MNINYKAEAVRLANEEDLIRVLQEFQSRISPVDFEITPPAVEWLQKALGKAGYEITPITKQEGVS